MADLSSGGKQELQALDSSSSMLSNGSPIPGTDWVQVHVGEVGTDTQYYINTVTGESKWELPESDAALAEGAAAGKSNPALWIQRENGKLHQRVQQLEGVKTKQLHQALIRLGYDRYTCVKLLILCDCYLWALKVLS